MAFAPSDSWSSPSELLLMVRLGNQLDIIKLLQNNHRCPAPQVCRNSSEKMSWTALLLKELAKELQWNCLTDVPFVLRCKSERQCSSTELCRHKGKTNSTQRNCDSNCQKKALLPLVSSLKGQWSGFTYLQVAKTGFRQSEEDRKSKGKCQVPSVSLFQMSIFLLPWTFLSEILIFTK